MYIIGPSGSGKTRYLQSIINKYETYPQPEYKTNQVIINWNNYYPEIINNKTLHDDHLFKESYQCNSLKVLNSFKKYVNTALEKLKDKAVYLIVDNIDKYLDFTYLKEFKIYINSLSINKIIAVSNYALIENETVTNIRDMKTYTFSNYYDYYNFIINESKYVNNIVPDIKKLNLKSTITKQAFNWIMLHNYFRQIKEIEEKIYQYFSNINNITIEVVDDYEQYNCDLLIKISGNSFKTMNNELNKFEDEYWIDNMIDHVVIDIAFID